MTRFALKSRFAVKLLAPALMSAAVTILVSSCASAPRPLTVTANGSTINIVATSFAFDPNRISVPGPGTYTLAISNKAGIEHNMTIVDPSGSVIFNVNLPPGHTEESTVDFKSAGTYPFKCNIDFHAKFGMTGTFTVASGG